MTCFYRLAFTRIHIQSNAFIQSFPAISSSEVSSSLRSAVIDHIVDSINLSSELSDCNLNQERFKRCRKLSQTHLIKWKYPFNSVILLFYSLNYYAFSSIQTHRENWFWTSFFKDNLCMKAIYFLLLWAHNFQFKAASNAGIEI